MAGYFLLKYFHVFGAIILLGTGAGIAFFMLMAHLSRNADFIARTASVVVLADLIFTATAVALQHCSGFALVWLTGADPRAFWIVGALVLYMLAGLFWLPVVWLQIRMRDLARAAAQNGSGLPPSYHRLFRIWFICGFPGFGAVAGVLWLMIAKPT